MLNKYSCFHLEDFIVDEYFFSLAKRVHEKECVEEWLRFLEENPDKKAEIEEAYLLINGIHIRQKELSDEKIQDQWLRLEKSIRSRKNRKVFYSLLAAATAACLVLFFSMRLYQHKESGFSNKNKKDKLSLLDELRPESNDVQVIIGRSEAIIIEEDACIQQKEDGSVIINDEKKVQGNAKVVTEDVQVVVPNGKRSSLTLMDGTRVWINSGTKLIYPSRFSDKVREIFIDGEIYLDVARNESLPFVVHTSGMDIRVLGTSFNVTSYKEDAFANVVLVSGSVEILTDDKASTSLKPNDCFHLENGLKSVKKVDIYNYTCWKDGVMKLEETPLNEIFNRLSRHYNIRIEYAKAYSGIRYKGKLSLDGTLEDVLDNIILTEPFAYEKKNNEIIINQ